MLPFLISAIPGFAALNYGNLVNRACHLNDGLVGWWLNLPQRGRGNTWFDIAGRNHGTLTNGPTWGGALSRAGGFGCIATVAASSQMVDCGTPSGVNGATLAAYSGWIYRSSTEETAGFGGSNGDTTVGNRFSCIWFTDSNIYFTTADLSASDYSFVGLSGIGWHHLFLAYDGSQSTNATKVRVWIDGQSQSLTYNASVPAALGTVGPWTLGRDSSNRYVGGALDDVRLYLGRTFADDFAWRLYQDSFRGYPLTLNRLRRATVFDTGGAVAEGGINSLLHGNVFAYLP